MMYGHEKSDRCVVPRKPPNKAEPSAAEGVEGRRLVKGRLGGTARSGHSAGSSCPQRPPGPAVLLHGSFRPRLAPPPTRDKSPVREFRTPGSVRGVCSNAHPYRDKDARCLRSRYVRLCSILSQPLRMACRVPSANAAPSRQLRRGWRASPRLRQAAHPNAVRGNRHPPADNSQALCQSHRATLGSQSVRHDTRSRPRISPDGGGPSRTPRFWSKPPAISLFPQAASPEQEYPTCPHVATGSLDYPHQLGRPAAFGKDDRAQGDLPPFMLLEADEMTCSDPCANG
jgi:hypothetical protein